jgi:uncharacterized protein (TIGR04255 family)
MAIHFPKKTEIRLSRPPLDEVVCQVRYPPLLRIASEAPSDFQEAIRAGFPLLKTEQGFHVQFSDVANPGRPSVEAASKTYRFYDVSEGTHIALCADFLALSTKKYTHWPDFEQSMDLAYTSMMKIYSPAHATRIGLRFINRLTLENTRSESIEEVLSLFRHELVCLVRTEAWDNPQEVFSQVILADDTLRLAVRFGSGTDKNLPFALLDIDCFEEGQIDLADLLARLREYHDRIYDAFRWCLLDHSIGKFGES